LPVTFAGLAACAVAGASSASPSTSTIARFMCRRYPRSRLRRNRPNGQVP
jgi:hypothetical protein